MKRRKLINRPLCLGDLILAVSSYSDSQEETVATVADLLASGQVSIDEQRPQGQSTGSVIATVHRKSVKKVLFNLCARFNVSG